MEPDIYLRIARSVNERWREIGEEATHGPTDNEIAEIIKRVVCHGGPAPCVEIEVAMTAEQRAAILPYEGSSWE